MKFGQARAESFPSKLTSDGLVCPLSSSICLVHGSYGTLARTPLSAFIAFDTCSVYNVTARSAFPPDYRENILPSAPLLRLAGTSKDSLQLSGLVKLSVRLGNKFFRLPFVVAERLVLPLVLGTAFADEHVRFHHIQARKVEFIKGGSFPPAQTFSHEIPADTRFNENRIFLSNAPSVPSGGETLSPMRPTKLTQVPSMTQMKVVVRRDAIGKLFFDPLPSITAHHGKRILNETTALDPKKEFDVIVPEVSRMSRTLPKSTVIE